MIKKKRSLKEYITSIKNMYQEISDMNVGSRSVTANIFFAGFTSPVDMCTSARFVEINWNNIMFTLALVLAMIWVIDVLKEKMASLPKALWYFVSFLIVAVLCIVAMNASLDYEHHAVLIGYFCYIFHERWILQIYET